MNKIVLSFAVCALMTTGAFAQISKGTIMAGASSNINYTSTSYDGFDDNENTFNLDLKGGYFVIDNLAFGLNIGYNKYSFGDAIDVSTTMFGIFGRYYYNGAIFAGVGYNSTKVEDSDAVNFLPIEVGYAAFITDDIAVEPSLSYHLGMGDVDANMFMFNVGFSIYFNRE